MSPFNVFEPVSDRDRLWFWLFCALFNVTALLFVPIAVVVVVVVVNVSSNSIKVSGISVILMLLVVFVDWLSTILPFEGNEKNVMSSCRRRANGFLCNFSSMICVSSTTLYWILFTFRLMLFELSSSDIDSEPFRNGFVHDFGPLLILATTSDKLMCATPQLAGLENCRFVTGRGMTVLLPSASNVNWLREQKGKLATNYFRQMWKWIVSPQSNIHFHFHFQWMCITLELPDIFVVNFRVIFCVHGTLAIWVPDAMVVAVFQRYFHQFESTMAISLVMVFVLADRQAYSHGQLIRIAWNFPLNSIETPNWIESSRKMNKIMKMIAWNAN